MWQCDGSETEVTLSKKRKKKKKEKDQKWQDGATLINRNSLTYISWGQVQEVKRGLLHVYYWLNDFDRTRMHNLKMSFDPFTHPFCFSFPYWLQALLLQFQHFQSVLMSLPFSHTVRKHKAQKVCKKTSKHRVAGGGRYYWLGVRLQRPVVTAFIPAMLTPQTMHIDTPSVYICRDWLTD